jgi:uncharacterized protein YjlB
MKSKGMEIRDGVRLTVLTFQLPGDKFIPNNRLPLLIYRGAFVGTGQRDPALIEELLKANDWVESWRNGIYPYHHYHSTAHEVLAVYAGSATVQFGGENGTTQICGPGDVVLIPAGVGHKNLGSTPDFAIVGAYPRGQEPDLLRGKPGERPKADENIARVAVPALDPVYGSNGPLLEHWTRWAGGG